MDIYKLTHRHRHADGVGMKLVFYVYITGITYLVKVFNVTLKSHFTHCYCFRNSGETGKPKNDSARVEQSNLSITCIFI